MYADYNYPSNIFITMTPARDRFLRVRAYGCGVVAVASVTLRT